MCSTRHTLSQSLPVSVRCSRNRRDCRCTQYEVMGANILCRNRLVNQSDRATVDSRIPIFQVSTPTNTKFKTQTTRTDDTGESVRLMIDLVESCTDHGPVCAGSFRHRQHLTPFNKTSDSVSPFSTNPILHLTVHLPSHLIPFLLVSFNTRSTLR